MARLLLLLLLIISSQLSYAYEMIKPVAIYAAKNERGFTIKLDIQKSWYIYAHNNGDSGLPLSIRIDGISEQDYTISWPEPIRKDELILDQKVVTYIYKDSVAIPVVLNDYDGKELDVKVTLGACQKVCIAQTEEIHIPGGSAIDFTLWASMLAFAFIGGLILNIMPCVLPVLALKLLNIVKYSNLSHRQVKLHLFSTSFGIISSFWLIAAITITLKELGLKFGWGFQFQNQYFLFFLIVVLGVYFTSLITNTDASLPRFIANRIPNNQKGVFGSFITGAFATLLATPCTAPFISTSVAFALSGNALKIALIYTFMGLGMSFPYYSIAMHQGFLKFIPKPGPWMLKVKRIFAIFILLTMMWLVSVLSSQTYVDKNLDISTQGWEKFTQEKLANYLAQDRIILVDVTADWCLTCLANKILVLHQKDVVTLLNENNVVKLRADFTSRSEEIADYIKSHGRYGIPLNVVYGPNAKKGIVVPEILSKESLMNAINLSKHP